MYDTHWNYILFRENSDILQIITSGHDFTKLDIIKKKIKVQDIKLITNSKRFKFEKENWENGTFTFEGTLTSKQQKKVYGHFRKDYISEEQELLIIDIDNFTDLYKFVKQHYKTRWVFILNM